MGWIDTALLTQMRADIANLLPDTCNLLTLTRTSDSQGGWSESWGTATASVACRIDVMGVAQGAGSEGLAGAALENFESYVLTLPHNTTITEAYRVECNGSTFNVLHVDDDKSGIACLRVRLEQV